MRRAAMTRLALVGAAVAALSPALVFAVDRSMQQLDEALAIALKKQDFTGRIEEQLIKRLGRPIHAKQAHLGRMLWFDSIVGLNDDNSCAGCHSPTRAMGDTQPIAIGIENNDIVGPQRAGPRNQRRSPSVVNTAFYPNLMWNSRFAAASQNPFDNRRGFFFPAPEGTTLSHLPHLLVAQAFIPPTERNEAAGFHFVGSNDEIRAAVVRRLSATPNYRRLFAEAFPIVAGGAPITFEMFARAVAEFEFTLTFANAPIDRFARGERSAMNSAQKEGALLFFGKAGCVACHAVKGTSNEMFSDFKTHNIGVPQIMPLVTNSAFDGLRANEDFGLAQVTGEFLDRYQFRTSPLRNVALQAAFFHNGAFTTLEDAIAHHLDVQQSARSYSPVRRLPRDLSGPTGPHTAMLKVLDGRVAKPLRLTTGEFNNLTAFVRYGLLDPRARPQAMESLIPASLPSGRPLPMFQTWRW